MRPFFIKLRDDQSKRRLVIAIMSADRFLVANVQTGDMFTIDPRYWMFDGYSEEV